MTRLSQLEEQAETQRAQFLASLSHARKRLTVPAIANEALRIADPRLRRIAPAYTAIKRFPVLAAWIFLGAAWLFRPRR